MTKSVKRFTTLLVVVFLVGLTIINTFAATIYYYFGYLYTYINNEKVSLYGIDDPEMEGLFVPATLNNKSLVDIRNNAFKNNDELHYLDFAGAVNLERIGSFAFSGCTAVSGEIKLPSNISTIETAAFENCSSVEAVVYDSLCGYVPNQCFNGCAQLSSVTLNEQVETIGSYAFANCSKLTYFVIPTAITEISETAFQNDSNLTLGVWYGSYGYDYAVAQNIPYVLLDEVKLGDANGDGYVNVNDVTAIQRHAAELEPLTGICFHAADVDGDGDVSVDDATELQRYLAEYAVDYPVGEKLLQ